jgi:Leucine-rich repeat (LRR) protein
MRPPLFLLILAGFLPPTFLPAIPAAERAALIALYDETGGEGWRRSDNWLGPPGSEGEWYGVTVENDRVVALDLSDNFIYGSLPEEMGTLTELRHLDLHGRFVLGFPVISPISSTQLGEFPPVLGSLGKLETLNLSAAGLQGDVPVEIGALAALQTLDLSTNSLTRLPSEVGQLIGLRTLLLDGNNLETVPPELFQLFGLETLDLSRNRDLKFPPVAVGPTGLRVLLLQNLGLASFPSWIGSLPALEALDLSNNPLESFPEAITEIVSLRELVLRSCGLSALPGSIADLEGLETLDLYWNQITELPSEIGALVGLRRLDLSNNPVQALPATLGGLENLEVLRLRSTHLVELPPGIGKLRRLRELDLDHSRLDGLPPGLGSLQELEFMGVSNNRLGGEVPAEIGSLSRLVELNLSRNPELGGVLPNSVENLVALRVLNLSGTRITGSVPEGIGNLRSLEILDLARTRVTGLPDVLVLADLTELTRLDLYFASVGGQIPEGLGLLPRLQSLILGGNRLTGEIPADLVGLGDASVMVRYNALYTTNPEVEAYLDAKAGPIDWRASQTVAPPDFSAVLATPHAIDLSWTPLQYPDTGHPKPPGHYEILHSDHSDGPFTVVHRTHSLAASSLRLETDGLGPGPYFSIRSTAFAHNFNPNTVVSEPSAPIRVETDALSRFYFPIFSRDAETFTGFAISNPDNTSHWAQLSAFSPSGRLLLSEIGAPQFVRNPAHLSIGAGGQIALLGTEIFTLPDGLPEVLAWVEVASDSPEVAGLFLLGGRGRLDGGPAVPHPAPELYFTRVHHGPESLGGEEATTTFQLANPGGEPVFLRLEGFSSAGEALGSAERTVPSRGCLAIPASDLLPADLLPALSHLRVSTDGEGAVTGFGVIRTERALIGLSGLTPQASTRMYSAQLADGPSVFTSVKLVNTDGAPREVILRAIADDGRLPAPKVVMTLDPGAALERSTDELFPWSGDAEESLRVGSLDVAVDGPGVMGDILFGDPDALRYASGLALQTEGFREALFAHVANGLGLFTGLALYNPSPESAEVTLKVYAPSGNLVGNADLALAAGARLSEVLTSLVPASADQVGGYILLESDRPVVAQALFGSLDLEYLSAVPPKRIR